jgi:hypothetical protein
MDEDHIHFYKQTNIVELGGQLWLIYWFVWFCGWKKKS